MTWELLWQYEQESCGICTDLVLGLARWLWPDRWPSSFCRGQSWESDVRRRSYRGRYIDVRPGPHLRRLRATRGPSATRSPRGVCVGDGCWSTTLSCMKDSPLPHRTPCISVTARDARVSYLVSSLVRNAQINVAWANVLLGHGTQTRIMGTT